MNTYLCHNSMSLRTVRVRYYMTPQALLFLVLHCKVPFTYGVVSITVSKYNYR